MYVLSNKGLDFLPVLIICALCVLFPMNLYGNAIIKKNERWESQTGVAHTIEDIL